MEKIRDRKTKWIRKACVTNLGLFFRLIFGREIFGIFHLYICPLPPAPGVGGGGLSKNLKKEETEKMGIRGSTSTPSRIIGCYWAAKLWWKRNKIYLSHTFFWWKKGWMLIIHNNPKPKLFCLYISSILECHGRCAQRDYKEGGPLLIVKNWGDRGLKQMSSSLVGSLGLSCLYKSFFLPSLLWSARYKTKFPRRISIPLFP